MASLVGKLAEQITAHAWNADRSKLAICKNNSDVVILGNNNGTWKEETVLKGHDLVVSSIDWDPVSNKIVTCSHDRNAFVWTLNETTNVWDPSLTILRINRAALSVRWSPNGKKFAVASGAKCVPVCFFESDHDWWISKMIKKPSNAPRGGHKSTVLDVAWHPNSQVLATASSDFKCRVFSAFVESIDASEDGLFGPTGDAPFGDLLAEFDANGWVESVAWSPSGSRLAFVAHDSSITFVHFGGSADVPPTAQTIKFSGLPDTKLLFLSDKNVVSAGHENNPAIYQANADGFWSFVDRLDQKAAKDATDSAGKKDSGFSAARKMFASQATRGQSAADSKEDNSEIWTKHENTIMDMCPFSAPDAAPISQISTSGIDGRVVTWDVHKAIGAKHPAFAL